MGNICWGITSFRVNDKIQSGPRNWSQNGAHPLILFFRIVNSFTKYGKIMETPLILWSTEQFESWLETLILSFHSTSVLPSLTIEELSFAKTWEELLPTQPKQWCEHHNMLFKQRTAVLSIYLTWDHTPLALQKGGLLPKPGKNFIQSDIVFR